MKLMLLPDSYVSMKCVNQLSKKIKNDPYAGTAFENARRLSSRTKGAFFEKLTKEYFSSTYGVQVENPQSSDHDVIFNSKKVEIKGSTLWCDEDGNTTHFRWQQIRLSQDYDVMVFLAMYPEGVRFFYATKEDLRNNLDPYKNNQHGGKNVNSGTMSIDGFPENFPWMKEIVDVSFVQ